MRLTHSLWKQSNVRQFKDSWLRKGVIKSPKFEIPKILSNKGVDIVDPNELYSQREETKLPNWEPSVKDDPRFMPAARPEDHPDYNEVPVHEFNQRSRLLEGEKQALLLTKSQSFVGLPHKITDLIGTVQIPQQDKLIQRYIMQANVWDPTKDKLPKRFNSQIPGWKFKSEWGIPNNKRSSILLSNLIRLATTLRGEYSDMRQSRRCTEKHYISTYYNFEGNRTIHIKGHSHSMISSSEPLKPFASDDMVDESVNHILQDTYPIAPTIDLQSEHIYKMENVTGWFPGYTHAHPHTLIINTQDTWRTSERNAKALLFCFGNCLAFAREKYGWDVSSLPEPVSMQCILSDGESFNFMAFQLNTLNMEGKDGIKNFVWFDNDNLMYNKIPPKRAMLRNTKYEDYNPEVFQKFLAFYFNGAALSSSISESDNLRASAKS